ncbi:glycosyltransferase family 61 protein [Heliobacterium mobile]|nr:glycosyltransferase family 61 protein [Heliobacterium mobile]
MENEDSTHQINRLSVPHGHVTTKEWVYKHSELHDQIQYIRVFPEHKIQRPLPKLKDGSVNHGAFLDQQTVESPEAFVAVIPQGRVWGTVGFVASPDNMLLSDVSNWFNTPADGHPAFAKSSLPTVCDFEGSVAVLSTAGWWNYYHWLFDTLPRYELLRKSHIEVDRFVVSFFPDSYQTDTLKILGVPEVKMIRCTEMSHIRAERLVIPSLPGFMGRIPAWVCEFLRRTFLPSEKPKENGRLRLYISRAKAAGRKIINESKLLDFLLQQNFQLLYLEEIGIHEQVRLFSNAEVIVAPHGAGLANLVFCTPGTKVLELLGPQYINPMFWGLCSHIPLEYRYLIGEGEQDAAEVNAFSSGNYLANFAVDVEKVESQLKDWISFK